MKKFIAREHFDFDDEVVAIKNGILYRGKINCFFGDYVIEIEYIDRYDKKEFVSVDGNRVIKIADIQNAIDLLLLRIQNGESLPY